MQNMQARVQVGEDVNQIKTLTRQINVIDGSNAKNDLIALLNTISSEFPLALEHLEKGSRRGITVPFKNLQTSRLRMFPVP